MHKVAINVVLMSLSLKLILTTGSDLTQKELGTNLVLVNFCHKHSQEEPFTGALLSPEYCMFECVTCSLWAPACVAALHSSHSGTWQRA